MNKEKKDLLRIIYLDGRQRVKYILVQQGITIRTRTPFQKAGELLKTFPIELIISQRQKLALYRGTFLPEILQLGGLYCGAYLAGQVLPASVVEQHNIPGGYATAAREGRSTTSGDGW